MAGSVNKVILVGNLGKDPEIRATQNGKEIANMSVATSYSRKDKNTGKWVDCTEWHRIVVYSDVFVSIVKRFVRKGSKIYVEGELRSHKWTDKDGAERYATEVVLQGNHAQLFMMDNKTTGNDTGDHGGGGYSSSAPSSSQTRQNHENDFPIDDEIPF